MFSYDLLQRLTSAYNPESGTTSYSSYDGDGNLKAKTDANYVTSSMNYDELDRMTLKTYATTSQTPGTSVGTNSVTYTYDDANVPYSIGRLTAVSNGNIWQIYGFDQLGRPTASAQTTNNAPAYVFLSYGYNLADQLTSETYPSGRVIKTTYDAAGRISGVNGNLPNQSAKTYASLPTNVASGIYSYAAHGAIQQMALGALTEQTCYNARLQPVVVRLGTGTINCASPTTPSSDALNLAYGYVAPNNGNIASQTITRLGSSVTQNYSVYDGLNRLVTASEGSNWSQTNGYDGYGNRAVTSGTVMNSYATATATNQFSGNRWSGASYDYAGKGARHESGGQAAFRPTQ